jgi:hypothetical protein
MSIASIATAYTGVEVDTVAVASLGTQIAIAVTRTSGEDNVICVWLWSMWQECQEPVTCMETGYYSMWQTKCSQWDLLLIPHISR